jgi:hypothetical protein
MIHRQRCFPGQGPFRAAASPKNASPDCPWIEGSIHFTQIVSIVINLRVDVPQAYANPGTEQV